MRKLYKALQEVAGMVAVGIVGAGIAWILMELEAFVRTFQN